MNPRAISLLVAYIATIPAANLAVEHWDDAPVGFGYAAPAGVYAVGIALVLRDLAREAAGRGAVLAAIAVGAALSWVLADEQERTAATDVIRRRRSIATARRLFAVELRRMADEAQQPTPAVTEETR
jgi:hypothetical protein